MSRAIKGITRRGLLAGASAAILAAAIQDSDARPLIMRGGHDADSGGVLPLPTGSYSLTYVNTAGTTSPANVPIQAMQWFAPGDVPAGSIAVPQIAAVDQVYQCDQRVYWGDGSLKGACYRIAHAAAIAAAGSVQFDWNIRVGTCSNTSEITTDDITAGSDYKIAITNCHTAQAGAASSSGVGAQKVLALTIAGGQVSGAKVWYPSNLTVGTTAVTNGSGSGASVSVSSGVVTVVNPGSGFANVGSGSFTVAFNSVIAAINSGGNHTGGVSLEQYAKGPVCDAWRARTTVSGLNHYHVTFYVERWKKADGTFLAFRACAVPGTGLVDTTNAIPNYTYSMDWKNGATVIRGTSNGDTGFQTMLHFAGSAFGTFGTDARMDWSTSHAAWTAIIQQRTPVECDQFKKSGVILPYLNLTPTATVPTTQSAYEVSLNGGKLFYGIHQPFGSAGIRTPLGTGGAGSQENPMNEVDALYWMSLRNSLTTNAKTWINNIRVGAAHSLSCSQLGGMFFEPTTLYIPNVIPASSAVFTGMTPTRENIYVGTVPITGYNNTMIQGGGAFAINGGPSIPYHQVCVTYGAYLIDGEQWQLDAQAHAAANISWSILYTSKRQATLGATTYYGIYCNSVGNVRVPTWYMRSLGYAVSSMPTAWADGTNAVERSYMSRCLKNQLDYYVAIASFIGSVKLGSGGVTVNKTIDYTGSGVDPENFDPAYGGIELIVPFMDSYRTMVAAVLAYLFQGDSQLGASSVAWRDYLKPYAIKLWAGSGSHFLCDTYRIKAFTGPQPSPLADPTWQGWSSTAPKLGIRPEGLTSTSAQTTLSTTSGSSVVTLSAGGVRFTNGVAMANGSRVMLTSNNTNTYGPSADGVPLGFDDGVWYYWLQGGTAVTGQLCTGLASGVPDPATVVVALESTTTVYFWVVPANTLPSDASGSGTYNGGISSSGYSRAAQELGRVRLWKAMGAGNDAAGNVDDAIANLTAICSAMGTSFASLPQYGWDSSRV